MIERKHRYGNLVFDRDAIVRAALRAYVEGIFGNFPIQRLSFPACAVPRWTGDLQRGAFCNDDQCGAYEVVAWTEAGVVGLAFELGFGPIEQLDLSVDAVTGGPDDVRGALPALPDELEPALVLAAGMLGEGPTHGEKMAGVGFWLYGDRVAGTLFDDPTAAGASRLAVWGLLPRGRLWPLSSYFHPNERAIVAEYARKDAPIHALIDAVVDRRRRGPTELTPDEIEMLFPTPPDPKHLLYAQRNLQDVGITWPGSPEIPAPPPRAGRNPFFVQATTIVWPNRFLNFAFDREPIVRVALRTYVEAVLVGVDPRRSHDLPPCVEPRWTGDLQRGAFYNGDGRGAYDVVAWTEAGVVGLAYELGFGPVEQLGLSASAVTGGPDDVRKALPLLPSELEPALELASGLLEVGAHGEKLGGVGFWLHGDCVGGLLFAPTFVGSHRLVAWGLLREGRLLVVSGGHSTIELNAARRARPPEPPLRARVDAVVARALTGPTELTTAELETLLPTPPDPVRLLGAQRMLQKVRITWPGSPELAEEPQGSRSG
jgi:hypothetical protein